MEELHMILERFAASGWELIADPARKWLDGKGDQVVLRAAVEQAERERGTCGCDLAPLYRRTLELL